MRQRSIWILVSSFGKACRTTKKALGFPFHAAEPVVWTCSLLPNQEREPLITRVHLYVDSKQPERREWHQLAAINAPSYDLKLFTRDLPKRMDIHELLVDEN